MKRLQKLPRRKPDTSHLIWPQEFYRELVKRPDVQRILTRLAKPNNGH